MTTYEKIDGWAWRLAMRSGMSRRRAEKFVDGFHHMQLDLSGFYQGRISDTLKEA